MASTTDKLSELIKLVEKQLNEKDDQITEKNGQLEKKKGQLQQVEEQMRTQNEASSRERALLLKTKQRLQQEQDVLCRRLPPRIWNELKCQKTLKCRQWCYSIAVQGNVVCVGVGESVLLFSTVIGGAQRARTLGLTEIKKRAYVCGVAFIDEDTIVVSSTDKRVRMYTTEDTTKEKIVGTFNSGKAGFDPRGLTVGPDGRIFVCDIGNHCVHVFNVDGKLLSSFGSEGSGVEQFNCPSDVCMDREGLLFISDSGNSRICVHSVEGAFIREFPTPRQPFCVAATHCNHIVVSSYSSHSVMIMTTSGQLVHEFGEEGSGPGQFSRPQGVAVDKEDCVYVCDEGNNRVQLLL